MAYLEQIGSDHLLSKPFDAECNIDTVIKKNSLVKCTIFCQTMTYNSDKMLKISVYESESRDGWIYADNKIITKWQCTGLTKIWTPFTNTIFYIDNH